MLTTIYHIKAIRDISTNLKDGRIVPYIREVEDAYIMPAIGVSLYRKLDTGETTDDVLLNGGDFTDKAGNADYCHGIRIAVAYFAYVRVLKNNGINVTAFGVQQKTSSLSQKADDAVVDDAATEAKKMGDLYLESCVRYLHRNDDPKPIRHMGSKLHMQVLK